MAGVVFLGGEAEAAAWRLAGLRAIVAPAGPALAAAFDEACADAELVLLDTATAARLPPRMLAAAQADGRALPCVLPGVGAEAPDPVVAAARRQLGMDE